METQEAWWPHGGPARARLGALGQLAVQRGHQVVHECLLAMAAHQHALPHRDARSQVPRSARSSSTAIHARMCMELYLACLVHACTPQAEVLHVGCLPGAAASLATGTSEKTAPAYWQTKSVIGDGDPMRCILHPSICTAVHQDTASLQRHAMLTQHRPTSRPHDTAGGKVTLRMRCGAHAGRPAKRGPHRRLG